MQCVGAVLCQGLDSWEFVSELLGPNPIQGWNGVAYLLSKES